ncbi:MAG: hypothetical protein KGS61_09840 [Verrucomicrobia bacterium]|nr:hypothetical protein [Verrucomicrobiota bacterium]
MKSKYLIGVGAVLLAAGGLWIGRAGWRAHRQLVTLDVREVPLAEVLRRIERQTWTKLRAEASLDTRITLRVTDQPLAYVLDRLAEQAGARWSTLYAVYDSSAALTALDAALRGDGRLEPAGWSRVVPDVPTASGAAAKPGVGPRFEGGGPMMLMAHRTPDGATIFETADGQTEVWAPQELAMETSLAGHLGRDPNRRATPETAAAIARQVQGDWAAYRVFRKSLMPAGPRGAPPGSPGSTPPTMNPNDRFARFTPEQRVRRAQGRVELNGN